VFDLLEEIAVREGATKVSIEVTIAAILARHEIRRILDATGSAPGRARALIDTLRAIRFPRLKRTADRLAAEIAAVSNAWGFRIRVIPLYAGKPLRLGDPSSEVRLFQRRHLLRRGELTVEGTVVRLTNPIQALTFASSDEHREYLEQHGVPHSALRRVLLFLRNARTLDRNTLRYLWIEAGFDQATG